MSAALARARHLGMKGLFWARGAGHRLPMRERRHVVRQERRFPIHHVESDFDKAFGKTRARTTMRPDNVRAPAMPLPPNTVEAQLHRGRLAETMSPRDMGRRLVARQLPEGEVQNAPAAAEVLGKEWDKLPKQGSGIPPASATTSSTIPNGPVKKRCTWMVLWYCGRQEFRACSPGQV